MPTWLNKSGQLHWRHMLPKLMKLGIIREVDGHMLACLCDSLATLQMARRRLDLQMLQLRDKKDAAGNPKPGNPDDALLIQYKSGAVQPNPLLGIISREKENIKRFGVEFGLSPSSRAKLMLEAELAAGESYEDMLAAERPEDDSEDDALVM
jgi:P27 family predicted phage terminase small subunit